MSTEEYWKRVKSEDISGMCPPLIGFTMQLLKDKPGWPADIRPIYNFLSKNTEWRYANSDRDKDGLLEYDNCSTSGVDNTVRFDSQRLEKNSDIGPIKPVEAIDYNSYMVCMHQVLSEMAKILGYEAKSKEHLEKVKSLEEKIEKYMWNEKDGFYYDLDARTNKQIKVKSLFSFMPLLMPDINKSRAERIVKDHLLNPKEFWTDAPILSVSIDDPAFSAIQMVRGSMWVNWNWQICEGLTRCGYRDIAKQVALKTVKACGPVYENGKRIRTPRINEWFNPLTGEPLGNENVSWTSLVAEMIVKYLDE